MLKRTTISILLISIFIMGTSSVLFYAAAPPTGYTGATPGQTCGDAGCHDNHAINSGGGNVTTDLPATYTPGTTINFSTIITHAAPAASRWGFSIKAVDGSGNTLGTFSTTNAAAAVNGNELSHLNAGPGAAAPSKTFNNLSWVPPVFNSGPVTFYYASVTGISGNDYVYTGSKTLTYLAPPPASIETAKVGIGTTAPYHKLDVKGNIWMGVGQPGNNFTPLRDAIYLGSQRKYLSNTLGAAVDGKIDWLNLMAHPFSAGIMFGLSGPSDADPHSEPNPLMVIRNNGYVGIGTATPVSTLDIRSASGTITVGTSGATGGALYLGNENHGFQRGFPVLNSDNNVGLMTTSGNLYLSTNGKSTGEFVLTDDGKIGIGTTAPNYALSLVKNGIGFSQESSDGSVKMGFYTGILGAYIQTHTNNDLFFATHNSTAQVVLTTAGNFGIGTTSPGAKLDVAGYTRSYGFTARDGTGGSFGANIHNFYWTGSSLQAWVDNVNVGTVSLTSDRRLKDQIKPQPDDALRRVLQLKPVSYHYKNIPGTIFKENPQIQEGFIADELQTVIPSAVNGEKNDITSDGQIKPQTLNIIPVVSVLTKAIQEQQKQIDVLKLENEKLKLENQEFKKELELIKAHLGIGSKAQK